MSDGAIRVALLWSTRLKWLPQELQVRSVSVVSTATSVGVMAVRAADFESARA